MTRRNPTSSPRTRGASRADDLAADAALLDDVVAEVNRLYQGAGLGAARGIGELLLNRLFGGDLDAFHARGPRYSVFSSLRARADLRPSWSFLWYSVAILGQMRVLPPEVGDALSLAHHRILVHVTDETLKLRLAREAVTLRLSKRALEGRVRESLRAQPNPHRKGRPPLPAFVRALRMLRQITEVLRSEPVSEAEVRRFAPNELNDLLDNAWDAVASLEDVLDAVREIAEGDDGGAVGSAKSAGSGG